MAIYTNVNGVLKEMTTITVNGGGGIISSKHCLCK